MDQLRADGRVAPFAEYVRELLADKQQQFVNCNAATFDQHKGRVLELQELLTYLTK